MNLVVTVVIAIGAIGMALFKGATTKPKKSIRARKKSVLELNINRLVNELCFPCNSGPKIAILGQPGAGKSSLLINMTKSKVRPLPTVGTQTDATDWSKDISCNLLSSYKDQVFADVPGYDTSSHPTSVFLSYFPFKHFDKFILVIHGKLHSSDEDIFYKIMKSGKQYCIARSYADTLNNAEKTSIKHDIQRRLSLPSSHPVLFFSNKTREGIEPISDVIGL